MKNLLIVEADAALNHQLSWRLVEQGYRVFSAMNHAEALRQCERRRIDLALFDDELPDGSGGELMTRFRVAHPETIGVLMAAPGAKPPFAEARLLSKPVSLEALDETLQTAWH